MKKPKVLPQRLPQGVVLKLRSSGGSHKPKKGKGSYRRANSHRWDAS